PGPWAPRAGGARRKVPDEFVGAPGSSPIPGAAPAVKFLGRGETVAPPPGRADNFAWPNGSEAKSARAAPEAPVTGQPNPEAVVAAKPKVVPAEAASALASAPADMKQQDRRKGSAGKLAQQKPAKKPPGGTRPRPPKDVSPRPPLPIEPLSGPWPTR